MDNTIDCACLIHGDKYSWEYVEVLHGMLSRNFGVPIRLHVWTEALREVPNKYIKHNLIEMGLDGPKTAWWYKTQLFNTAQFKGKMYYFDLDIIVASSLKWLTQLDTRSTFWAVRDFKYLWKDYNRQINSSVMVFDNSEMHWIWDKFYNNKEDIVKKYHGDQDYINECVINKEFLNEDKIKSYRWQVLHGGLDFKNRSYPRRDEIDVELTPDTSLVIFHGKPNPHEVNNAKLTSLWQR